MSGSWLYQGFGIWSYRDMGTRIESRTMTLQMVRSRESLSSCRS